MTTIGGKHFFGAFLMERTFLCESGMSKGIPKKKIDVTGVVITPGEPTVCLGNGEQGYECCCDECDYLMLCCPECIPKEKEAEEMSIKGLRNRIPLL